MAALCNTTGHYIFVLWFLLLSIYLLFSGFFPRLFSAVADWILDVYHTSTHRVSLVRIHDTGLKRAVRFSLKIQDAKNRQLECGPMPNLMAALPNIGGALCSTPQSLADAHY